MATDSMGSETSGSVSVPGSSSSSSTKARQEERSSSPSSSSVAHHNKRERFDHHDQYSMMMKNINHDHRSSNVAGTNPSLQNQPMLMSLSSSSPSSSSSSASESGSVGKISQTPVVATAPLFFPGTSFRSVISPQQYLELESQSLIYKYIDANVPIPSNLLMPIKNSLKVNDNPFLSASNRVLQPNPLRSRHANLNFSSNTDPEPRRCRRTDGKKWRCSRDIVDPHKYCERHLSRARHRSRKHVECPSNEAAAAAGSANGDSRPPSCLAPLRPKFTLLQFSTSSSSSNSSGPSSNSTDVAANYSCSSARAARAKRISRREERKRFIASRIQQSLVHLGVANEQGILVYPIENQAVQYQTSNGMEIQHVPDTNSLLMSSTRSLFDYLEEYGSSPQGLNLLQDLPEGPGITNFNSDSSGLSHGSIDSEDLDHDQVLHATSNPTTFTPPTLDDNREILTSVTAGSSDKHSYDQEGNSGGNSKSLNCSSHHGHNDQEVNSKISSPELNDRQEAGIPSIFIPSPVRDSHQIYCGDLVYPEFNYQQIESKSLSSSPAIEDQEIHSKNVLDSYLAPPEIELDIHCFSPFRNLGHIDKVGPSFDDLYMMKWLDDDDIAWPPDDDYGNMVFKGEKLLDLEQKDPVSISIPVVPNSPKHTPASSTYSPPSSHYRETSTSPSALSIWNAFEPKGVGLGIEGILNFGDNLKPNSDRWDPSCLGPLGEVFKATSRATSQEHHNASSLLPSNTAANKLPLNNNSTGKAPNNCNIGSVDGPQSEPFGSIPMNRPPN